MISLFVKVGEIPSPLNWQEIYVETDIPEAEGHRCKQKPLNFFF
jgi:hypothetical protein